MAKNISRRRALGFAAKSAGVAGAATVAMSVNPAMAAAAPTPDDLLPNNWFSIAPSQGDQFPEIQEALDNAEEAGGGVVYLQSGTFQIGNTLFIGENVTLMGEGAATSISGGSKRHSTVRLRQRRWSIHRDCWIWHVQWQRFLCVD